tara:strand:- start:466 stop:756 length:291 start_codon:yes stop_codon:yes gene_type:complete
MKIKEKKRDKILDKIIDLRKEYKNSFGDGPLRVMSMNERMKYASTQDDLPRIPSYYLHDLGSNISDKQKIDYLVGLIEKTYDITDQERTFLKTLGE